MSLTEKKITQLRHIINNSHHLVCVVGSNMQKENGYPIMQESDWAYDIEMKYGNSPEEIFNTSFYSTRKEQFFDFFRDEMLSKNDPPNEAFKALAELEHKGIIKTIITTGIYSLPVVAGCKNVIELYGSVYNNYCGHCRKKYSLDYIKNSKKVPICDVCHSVVRPGVFLYVEMIDNQVMTKAMEEITMADTLLVVGGSLVSPNIDNFLRYFKGKKLVIVNEEPHHSDVKAQLVINDKALNVLPKIL